MSAFLSVMLLSAANNSKILCIVVLVYEHLEPHASQPAESQIDFAPNTARPHPAAPEDKSRDMFLSADDVQTSPLPKGQVMVVMKSYDKTIGGRDFHAMFKVEALM